MPIHATTDTRFPHKHVAGPAPTPGETSQFYAIIFNISSESGVQIKRQFSEMDIFSFVSRAFPEVAAFSGYIYYNGSTLNPTLHVNFGSK